MIVVFSDALGVLDSSASDFLIAEEERQILEEQDQFWREAVTLPCVAYRYQPQESEAVS